MYIFSVILDSMILGISIRTSLGARAEMFIDSEVPIVREILDASIRTLFDLAVGILDFAG
jgi:hypothetical protein